MPGVGSARMRMFPGYVQGIDDLFKWFLEAPLSKSKRLFKPLISVLFTCKFYSAMMERRDS